MNLPLIIAEEIDGYMLSGRNASRDECVANLEAIISRNLSENWILSAEDINLIRQWFNAMNDLNPKYVTDADRNLANKLGLPCDMQERITRP